MVSNRTAEIEGLDAFYREAGDPVNPKLLLLGGFRVISPVPQPHPGARRSLPRPLTRLPGLRQHRHAEDFEYTFDRLSQIVEGYSTNSGSARSGSTTRTTAAR